MTKQKEKKQGMSLVPVWCALATVLGIVLAGLVAFRSYPATFDAPAGILAYILIIGGAIATFGSLRNRR